MKNKDCHFDLSWIIQVLVLLLVGELVIAWLVRNDSTSTIAIFKIIFCLVVYLFSKYIYRTWGDEAIRIIVFVLMIWLLGESLIGLLQIYGMIPSNHNKFQITGSFHNPNPYAGFLVVLSSIIYSYNYKNPIQNKYIRVLYYITLSLVIIVLPATRCRSSFCALIVVILMYLWKNPRYRALCKKYILLILSVLTVLAYIMYMWKRPSVDWRVFQNKMSLISITNNGFWGAGLGHYSENVSKTQMNYFSDALSLREGKIVIPEDSKDECRIAGRTFFAFCDFIQIGVEAGIITMTTFVMLVLFSLLHLHKTSNPLFYGLVPIVVISFFSYPLALWQNELLFSLIIGIAGRDRCHKAVSIISDLSLLSIFIVVLSFCTPFIISVRRNTKKWESDRYFFNSHDYTLYCRYCEDKINTLNNNELFLLEYGISLSKTDNIELSDSVLSLGFESSGNPSFLIYLGHNSLLRNNPQKAEKYYWDSFCCVPDRILPLSCLANLYKSEGMKDELDNIRIFMENYKPRVESEVTDYLKNMTIEMMEDEI